MIQIFLDNTQVYIKDGSTVKLTVENPMFDSGDSYTYEVELPLHIPQNRAFFGPLNRIDVSKGKRTFEARMMTDNRTVLTGTAVLTQVTETVARVQLLGSNAAMNFANASDGRYIDELELGDFASDSWPDKYSPGIRGSAYGYFPGNSNVLPAEYATSGKLGWVAYPVENSNADCICNEWRLIETAVGSGSYALAWEPKFVDIDGNTLSPSIMSPQPFLWFIAKKIAEATGATLADEDNILKQDDFLKRLFIVNASGYAQWNRALPHWTVNEWWRELQNSFGVVFYVDSSGRGRTVGRTSYYHQDTAVCHIPIVADELTVSMGEDSGSGDVSVSNVGFADFDADPIELLDQGVLDSARFIDTFDSLTAIREYAESLNDKEEWLESVRDVIFRCADGHQYIYFANYEGDRFTYPLGGTHPTFREVNIYRPRMANADSENVEVELRFVPCKFVDYEPAVLSRNRHPGAPGTSVQNQVATGSPVKILSRPDREETADIEERENVVLEDIINGDAEAVDKDATNEDVCYVAIQPDMPFMGTVFTVNNSAKTSLWPCPQRMTGNWWDVSGTQATYSAKYSLTLNRAEGINNIYTAQIADGVHIDARVKQCIKFYSESIPAVTDLFVIRNKRFACEKLEINITAQGMDRLITGYFYAIDL